MDKDDNYGLTSSRFLKDWAMVILASVIAVVVGSFFPLTFLMICLVMIFAVCTAFMALIIRDVIAAFGRK